ncbi:RagB/SusD family nutrient uptake outer membrane protein [Terrimonas rubra]|uniref:RagB/SusD family nutrient uptake outer membrane protein n=1 Tax=Terrimonas rubra TaxID=1035890 RepID=A0ABW6A4U8_9BACT
MKFKYIKSTALVVVVSTVLFACQKKTVDDVTPIDQIPAETAIKEMADVTRAVNGVYGTLSPRRSVYINATISDEIRLGTGTEYRNVGNILFNWNHVSDSQDWRDGETGGVWTNLYTVIDRANRVLELMEPVPTPTAADVALKAQYKGEMLAMRAYAHLELLKLYSETAVYTADKLGIVVQTEYVKAPGSYKPVRTNQSAAVAQINTDLIDAKPLIPASFTNISRLTKNAVSALQAKLALHIRDWPNVITYSTEVINAQPVSTIATFPAIFQTRILAQNQSSEVVFKYNVVSGANLGSALGSLWQDVGAGAAVQATPAEKLQNTFDKVNDVRYATYFYQASPTSRVLIAKHGVNTGTNGENFSFDLKVIRTSELLLARAEAYAESTQPALANADLKKLRESRITGYTHTDVPAAGLVEAIYLERYKELCYEGHRYYDLRRRSLPIERTLADAGGLPASQTLQPTNTKYLLPIPQQERFANPTIQQNAGY